MLGAALGFVYDSVGLVYRVGGIVYNVAGTVLGSFGTLLNLGRAVGSITRGEYLDALQFLLGMLSAAGQAAQTFTQATQEATRVFGQALLFAAGTIIWAAPIVIRGARYTGGVTIQLIDDGLVRIGVRGSNETIEMPLEELCGSLKEFLEQVKKFDDEQMMAFLALTLEVAGEKDMDPWQLLGGEQAQVPLRHQQGDLSPPFEIKELSHEVDPAATQSKKV